MFQNVAIIGVGLIGGSIAMALKKYNLARKIIGVSRSKETIRKALKSGIIDGGGIEPPHFSRDADLIILCTPVNNYRNVIGNLSGFLKSSAVITDVGSVKKFAIDEVLPGLSPKHRSTFVPGHPIAGKEESGLEAADADLFHSRDIVLTPVEQTNKTTCSLIENMWTEIGGNVIYMTPERHDEIYAHVSHAVQFLAYTYRVSFPGQTKNTDPAFKKFFRIAKSDSKMWLGIFSANKHYLVPALKKFKKNFLDEIGHHVPEETKLPKLVSAAAIKMAEGFTNYAGTGFRDFTSAADAEIIKCDQTMVDVPNFVAWLDTLTDALENGNLEHHLPKR